jgi:hypothetical protein
MRFPLPLPRRRRWRILLAVGAVVVLYLTALSVTQALRGGDAAAERRARGQRAIQAPNWGLVRPEDRAALGRAVDDAWRALRSYHMRYVSGRPDDLAAGRFETEAESLFRLNARGYIALQQDRSYISAASPAGSGGEERLEGFRVLTGDPYLDRRGRRIADTELVYQRGVPGAWRCERVPADRSPPLPPSLDFTSATDAGFDEIDGRLVRKFVFGTGAFGLRAPATVWIETDTLRVRRQEIVSVLPGRREVWTYDRFDELVHITPPTGVVCEDAR